MRREKPKPPRRGLARSERFPIGVFVNVERLPIIHSGAAKVAVIDDKSERMNQMQPGCSQCAHASDVSRVGRNFRLKQHDVNHAAILSVAAAESSRVAYCVESSFVQPANFQTVTSPRKAIVIVDDEKAYIDIMATMLTEQLGCQVITFTRPLDALAALPNLSVGVIVTDCNMPQFSGYEFIRRASALVPGVPFILMTGNVQDGEEELTSNSPLRSILPKPFGWKKLADEIIRHAPEFAVRLNSTPATPTQS